uniref:Heat shock protein homolog n=1 Tax=Caligus clemensi TaxID=344056 RepID=C1C1Z3_CALCM|nr:Heat shock protein homolog [Caligus clemensi]
MSRDTVPINVRDPFWKDPFFSSTWDEFERMRTEMMNSSKDFWGRIDDDFKNFDESVRKTHEEMDRQMAPLRPQLPNWAIPNESRDSWAPMIAHSKDDQVIKIKDENEKFEIAMDVSQYRPEELKVTTFNDTISVEGQQEQKTGDGVTESFVTKQFSRKWSLPPQCRSDSVVSNLSSDGVLIITAPKISPDRAIK